MSKIELINGSCADLDVDVVVNAAIVTILGSLFQSMIMMVSWRDITFSREDL